MRRVRVGAALAAALLLGAWSPSKLAAGSVRSALRDAGLSDANANCMAGRMTDKLSLKQLWRLKKLNNRTGRARSMPEYVSAVRELGDSETLAVTASAAALCASGWG